MDAKGWDKLVNDLKSCVNFVDQASKGLAKSVDEAGQAVKEKINEAQQSNNEALKKRCDEVQKMVELVSSTYDRQILLAIGTKYFASRYSLYRDIVIGFKQQSNNTQQQTTNTTNTTNTENNTNTTPTNTDNGTGAENTPNNTQNPQ